MKIPLTRPAPPRLSLACSELQALEQSGIFSNFGPVNTCLEQEMLTRFFHGHGSCTTVCNATIGLMLAIKESVGESAHGRFALMPSFTFPAAAHAALWCGLTPLLCDIDPATWALDSAAELRMLERYRDEIAVVVPYATFGYPIDLEHYERITAQFGIPVVVDAAASLGTLDMRRLGFGTGFSGTVVFSMHATKSFATGEGGLIYSANPDRVARLRTMSNFGFGEPHTATMPGLNAKLSEVSALIGRLRLADYDHTIEHRESLFDHYRHALPELKFQLRVRGAQAHQFVPALLPIALSAFREGFCAEMADLGIATGTYFSPHLVEQPYLKKRCVAGPMPVCESVAARIISLPLYDAMTHEDVEQVAECTRKTIDSVTPEERRRKLPNGQSAQIASEAVNRAPRGYGH